MTDSTATLLEARELHLWRGEKHLLRGVSFKLEAGQFVQLVGPNGVGKTSLLRSLCGLIPLESGEVLWRGALIESCREEFHSELAYLAHSNALKGDLTALENLKFELALRIEVREAEIVSQLAALGVEHCTHLPARSLSAGQKRRVGLARLLLSRSKLWVLDEPTTNLDTSGIALVEKVMADHLGEGGAIIAAAHHTLLGDRSFSRSVELRA